jgi:hypothetical protein
LPDESAAVLPPIVEFVIVAVPALQIAPLLKEALFPLIVESVTVRVPALWTAPPKPEALLLSMMEFVTVRDPLLKMPPPRAADPNSMVTPDRDTDAVAENDRVMSAGGDRLPTPSAWRRSHGLRLCRDAEHTAQVLAG